MNKPALSMCSKRKNTKKNLWIKKSKNKVKKRQHQQIKLRRNKNQNVKVKRNHKRKALIKLQQVNVYVNNIQSLTHNYWQHLHHLKSWKEIGWSITLKIWIISIKNDSCLQTRKSSKERTFLHFSNRQHSFWKIFINQKRFMEFF